VNWDAFLSDQLTRTPKANLPPGCGFVCAADACQFIGFQVLYASVVKGHRNLGFVLYDLGLTDAQRAWCRRVPLVELRSFRNPLPDDRPGWQKWCRPWLLLESPFELSVWADNDVVLLNTFEPVFVRAKRSFAVSRGPAYNLPERRVYDYVGPLVDEDEMLAINSGVLAYSPRRGSDRLLLETWRDLTVLLHAHPDRPFEYLAPVFDESVLRLTLQKIGRADAVQLPPQFNRFVLPGDPLRKDLAGTLDRCRNKWEREHALHLIMAPKPWEGMGLDLLDIDPHRCA
jgi:hypothetical protein